MVYHGVLSIGFALCVLACFRSQKISFCASLRSGPVEAEKDSQLFDVYTETFSQKFA